MDYVAHNSLAKAMCYLDINQSRSFVHFLVALNLHPEWKEEMSSVFVSLTHKLSEELLSARRVNDFFNYFEQALELYPESPELKYYFSKHLQSLGYSYRAFSFLSSAVRLKPEEPIWSKELDAIKNILIERWHYRMLNDSIRNNAYRRAILYCVNEFSSVLDIGCGSGLLSLYAAEKKPKRLVAVESNETLYNVATAVFSDNNLDNVILKNTVSTSLHADDISGRVSVIITEIFDGGFFGEGILQTMIHAREHLMENTESDIVIPKSGSLYICGIHSSILSGKRFVLNHNSREGMCLKDFIIYSDMDESYDTEDLNGILDVKYLTDINNFLNINFLDLDFMQQLNNGDKNIDIELTMKTSAEINAFGVWFDLNLCDNIKITTNPCAEDRAKAWEQTVIYIDKPVTYEESSLIKLSLSCKGGKLKLCPIVECEENNKYPVPLQVIRLLNDFKYLHACSMAASAICVHLSQIVALKDMHILDCSPFPVFGFLLLGRGIQSLTCVANTSIQKLIINVAISNSIDPKRIHFLEKYDLMDLKNTPNYNLIVSNFIKDFYGELNSKEIKHSKDLKYCGGGNAVIIPYKIRMMGRLIYSDEVERINRVNNINVCNYKVGEWMNIFQVGQNYISDISSFSYTAMSRDVVIFEQCMEQCSHTIVDAEIIKDGQINAVLCWYQIQLLEKWEFYSTLGSDSFLDTTLHVLEPNLFGNLSQNASILVCVESDYVKLAVDLDNTIE